MESTCVIHAADLVDEIGSLPSAAASIVGLTVDPDCAVDDLVRAIGADPAMAMRFMALANSAAVARGREIRDLRGALVRLGLRRVRNVALLTAAHDMMPADGLPGFDAEAFWRFNLAVAACTAALAAESGSAAPEDAWLSGLLQGVGVAVLARRQPDALVHALAVARADGLPLAAAERRVLGFDHAEVGARLAEAWRLPVVLRLVFGEAGDGASTHPDAPVASALRDLVGQAVRIVRAARFGAAGDGDAVPSWDEAAGSAGLDGPTLDALARRVGDEVEDTARFLGVGPACGRFEASLAAARDIMARIGLDGIDEAMAREDLEAQLAVARRIQQRLLPRPVNRRGCWELAAVNRPSQHVSGDVWDVIDLADGGTAILAADVCGKGLPAALLATSLLATIRALAAVISDPGALLTAANRALAATTDDEHFATVFLAVLDNDGRGLRYASAGHLPPLLLRRGGEAQWLPPAGLPVGLVPGTAYAEMRVAMQQDDLLLIMTDGAVEAEDARGMAFGRGGVESAVRAAGNQPLPRLLAGIEAALSAHAAEAAAADDVTLVAARPDR
jgi:HD-like signal output (HDOD) protein